MPFLFEGLAVGVQLGGLSVERFRLLAELLLRSCPFFLPALLLAV